MDYYASYKNSKDPSLLRKELVSYAISYGNKKAAQHFQTTVKTVRKWRKRWQEKKGAGLKDLSKKPKKSPCMMKMYWQFKIKSIAEKAAADNKRINGAMIKREYSIPYSAKTIVKYLKQYYKLPSKKTHRRKKLERKSSFKQGTRSKHYYSHCRYVTQISLTAVCMFLSLMQLLPLVSLV